MRYNKIRKTDISNGEGIGVTLFVQGCRYHCNNCFNKETWDFNGGKEWTEEVEEKFLNLLSNSHIKRVTFLGGEPMEYAKELFDLVVKIKIQRPDIKIWTYTGYKWEELKTEEQIFLFAASNYLIDGKYIDELKDLNLLYRGSSNQRIIDVKETFKQNKLVLYKDGK